MTRHDRQEERRIYGYGPGHNTQSSENAPWPIPPAHKLLLDFIYTGGQTPKEPINHHFAARLLLVLHLTLYQISHGMLYIWTDDINGE